MALDGNIIKERLKETFNGESQEAVAAKLNMTQGSVSKLLTGKQIPTLETLYHIATIYGKSIDWLTGLSDKSSSDLAETSYASIVKAMIDLVATKGMYYGPEIPGGPDKIFIHDPLAGALFDKGTVLRNTDEDLYNDWVKTKLSLFKNKSLIHRVAWDDKLIQIRCSNNNTEQNWLTVYDMALRVLKEYEAELPKGE